MTLVKNLIYWPSVTIAMLKWINQKCELILLEPIHVIFGTIKVDKSKSVINEINKFDTKNTIEDNNSIDLEVECEGNFESNPNDIMF